MVKNTDQMRSIHDDRLSIEGIIPRTRDVQVVTVCVGNESIAVVLRPHRATLASALESRGARAGGVIARIYHEIHSRLEIPTTITQNTQKRITVRMKRMR